VLTTSSRSRASRLLAVAATIPLIGSVQAQAPAATSTAPAAASAEQIYFDVHEYRVLGNTTLTNRDIESVLYPLLGDHKTLADVEVARAALEKTYHDRGFGTVFVDIPEQSVDSAIVRLKVTEGRLNEVRTTGARYFSERKILAAVPAATAGTVPNVLDLQKQISAVSVQTSRAPWTWRSRSTTSCRCTAVWKSTIRTPPIPSRCVPRRR
jgi:hemolysin activation/secretion protein